MRGDLPGRPVGDAPPVCFVCGKGERGILQSLNPVDPVLTLLLSDLPAGNVTHAEQHDFLSIDGGEFGISFGKHLTAVAVQNCEFFLRRGGARRPDMQPRRRPAYVRFPGMMPGSRTLRPTISARVSPVSPSAA